MGVNIERINEGYKGYRKFVIENLPELNDKCSIYCFTW